MYLKMYRSALNCSAVPNQYRRRNNRSILNLSLFLKTCLRLDSDYNTRLARSTLTQCLIILRSVNACGDSHRVNHTAVRKKKG